VSVRCCFVSHATHFSGKPLQNYEGLALIFACPRDF
jgi:hypothetical protein